MSCANILKNSTSNLKWKDFFRMFYIMPMYLMLSMCQNLQVLNQCHLPVLYRSSAHFELIGQRVFLYIPLGIVYCKCQSYKAICKNTSISDVDKECLTGSWWV